MMRQARKKEQGAVLIIALIMLLILTILGVAVLDSSVLEERMAGNYIERNRAFQAAEAGLRAGERWVAARVEQPIAQVGYAPNRVAQLNTVVAGTANWWANTNSAWWLANGNNTGIALTGVQNSPRYVIEEYDDVCDGAADPSLRTCKIVYRVTAMGWSGRNATVMLQSLFTRRY